MDGIHLLYCLKKKKKKKPTNLTGGRPASSNSCCKHISGPGRSSAWAAPCERCALLSGFIVGKVESQVHKIQARGCIPRFVWEVSAEEKQGWRKKIQGSVLCSFLWAVYIWLKVNKRHLSNYFWGYVSPRPQKELRAPMESSSALTGTLGPSLDTRDISSRPMSASFLWQGFQKSTTLHIGEKSKTSQ